MKSTDWVALRDTLQQAGLYTPVPSTSTDDDVDIPQPPPARASTFTGTPRPANWEGFIGNPRVVQILRDALNAATTSGKRMDHTLIFGPPGTGKTTLSKLVAAAIGGVCLETTASTLEKQQDVIRVLARLNRTVASGKPAVLFLDEIHMLGKGQGRSAVDQEALYPLLEDFVFPHNLSGTEMLDDQGNEIVIPESPLRVFPFLCIGATTEAGMLSEPLRRRFLVQAEMDPYEEADIAKILLGAATMLGFTMSPEAAEILSQVSRRTPGQAMQLLTQTKNSALATGPTTELRTEDAEAVITRMRFFPLGLTEKDVLALRVLANRGKTGVGQLELSRALGISLSQWTGLQEPYLRQLGFIETLTRRVITIDGLIYLANNNLINLDLPIVRAALARRA